MGYDQRDAQLGRGTLSGSIGGVTADANEVNLADGSIAGTSVASKLLCLGANKETDVLVLPVSGLKIGAGAGTAMDCTAAELNKNNGVTAGTAAASKTAVLGAAKNLDTLAVALCSVGAAGIETGLTAHAGGGQASAQALSASASFHEVTTVGSGNDSVKLPAATGSGNIHIIKNSAAANSLQVFGQSTETIDGVTSATGVAIAAGKARWFIDSAAGKWQSLLGA